MAHSIDESDLADLDPDQPQTRRARRAQERAALPRQARGEDQTPASGDPADQVEPARPERPEADGDVVPQTPRRPRRAWGRTLAVVLVLALLTGGGYLWWHSTRPQPAPAPAPAAADQTAFISLTTGDNRFAAGLYAAVRGEEASVLLVPADLVLDVPGPGTATLRDTPALGTDVPGQAVSDALGVPVQGHWVLPFDGLVALVDELGGVPVDVDVPVHANDVTLAPGPQTLTGVQAATYAGWSLAGEPRAGQMVRSGQVLTAVIRSLPQTEAQVSAVLAKASGTTTLEPGELAAFLVRVRDAQAAGDFGAAMLPVVASPVPDNPEAVAVDLDAASDWLDTVLPGLQQARPGRAGQVQVRNAAAVDQVQAPARTRLLDAGFGYTYAGTAEPVQPATVVMYSAGRDNRDQAVAAAAALHLPGTAVQVSDDIPVGTDVVILLGTDFATANGLSAPAVPAAEDPATGGEGPGEGGPAEGEPAPQDGD